MAARSTVAGPVGVADGGAGAVGRCRQAAAGRGRRPPARRWRRRRRWGATRALGTGNRCPPAARITTKHY